MVGPPCRGWVKPAQAMNPSGRAKPSAPARPSAGLGRDLRRPFDRLDQSGRGGERDQWSLGHDPSSRIGPSGEPGPKCQAGDAQCQDEERPTRLLSTVEKAAALPACVGTRSNPPAEFLEGTSFATPMVAGTIALMNDAFRGHYNCSLCSIPSLPVEIVRAVLPRPR